jgi:transcriptional regulator with XRE-family HTH domain
MKPGTTKHAPYKDIGERFRAARGQKSRKEFADLLGVTVQALSLIELGQRMPSAEMLRRVQQATRVDPNTILMGPPSNRAELRDLANRTMLQLLPPEQLELIRQLIYLFHEGTERSQLAIEAVRRLLSELPPVPEAPPSDALVHRRPAKK